MAKTVPEHVVQIDSPAGRITLASRDGCLTHLLFGEHFSPTAADDVLTDTQRQLEEYFAGARTQFDIPLKPAGTEFQLAVWRALQYIPYGETVTYGDIARSLGRPKAYRAVGQANHVNPISIIIPCHRVVGSGGSLTGYGGGLPVKEMLLRLEKGNVSL